MSSDPLAPGHRHCAVESKTLKAFSLYSVLLLVIWRFYWFGFVWFFFLSSAATWPAPAVESTGVKKERFGRVALTGGVEEP